LVLSSGRCPREAHFYSCYDGRKQRPYGESLFGSGGKGFSHNQAGFEFDGKVVGTHVYIHIRTPKRSGESEFRTLEDEREREREREFEG
jgi:hypothetical protein